MDAELRATRSRILDAVRVWKVLVPPGVTVRHIFIEGDTDTESPEVVAETKAAWEYHSATIRWSLTNAAHLSQEKIDKYLVHELMHVYLAAIESHLRADDTPWNAICEHTVEALSAAYFRCSSSVDCEHRP